MATAKTQHHLALKWLQGGGTKHRAVGRGFDAQKLMSWSRFSQGNGSRIFSHRAWSFLHGDLCPLEVPVWAYRKDLYLKIYI